MSLFVSNEQNNCARSLSRILKCNNDEYNLIIKKVAIRNVNNFKIIDKGDIKLDDGSKKSGVVTLSTSEDEKKKIIIN